MAAADAPSGSVEAPAGTASLRHVRAGIAFSFFNAMTWQVALGTPMVLFGERLGASAAAIGLAYSFVFLLTPIQVLATSLLPRYGFKRMMLSGWGSRSLFLLPAIAVAWLAPERGTPLLVAIFIGSLFVFTFCRALGACAYLPWLNSLLNEQNRGRYFATEQAMSGIAGVGTLLLCSYSLEVLPIYRAFFLQYSFAFLGSWLAYFALARLSDAPKPSALPLREVALHTPRLIFAPGAFRGFLLIGVCTGAAVTAIPPFCAYFLRVGPHLSEARIVFFTTVQYVGVIAGALLIRNRIDRVGARTFFHLALLVYVAIALFWLGFLRGWFAGVAALPAVYFAVGVAASLWSSGTMQYLPLVVAPEQRTLAFSVHSAVTSVVSGLSPVIWGWFIKGGSGAPSVDGGAFQVFFVVALVTVAVVFGFVWRLPKEAGRGHEWFPAGVALRPFRALTYFASLVQPPSATTPALDAASPSRRARAKPDEPG